MVRALSAVIVVGIGIGLMLPGGRAARPATTVAVASPAAPTSPTPAPAPTPVRTDTVIQREQSGHFLAYADVNHQPTRFIVDTGADTVALTEEDARRAGIMIDSTRYEVVGRGGGGPVRGQQITIDRIDLDGKHAEQVRGVVLEGATMSLLGQTFLRSLDSVEISNDKMTLR